MKLEDVLAAYRKGIGELRFNGEIISTEMRAQILLDAWYLLESRNLGHVSQEEAWGEDA